MKTNIKATAIAAVRQTRMNALARAFAGVHPGITAFGPGMKPADIRSARQKAANIHKGESK